MFTQQNTKITVHLFSIPEYFNSQSQSDNTDTVPETDTEFDSNESENLSHIPVSLSISSEPSPILLAVIDSITSAREHTREFSLS